MKKSDPENTRSSAPEKEPYRLSLESQIAGGHARAAVLSRERRREIARMGSEARWGKAKKRRAKKSK